MDKFDSRRIIKYLEEEEIIKVHAIEIGNNILKINREYEITIALLGGNKDRFEWLQTRKPDKFNTDCDMTVYPDTVSIRTEDSWGDTDLSVDIPFRYFDIDYEEEIRKENCVKADNYMAKLKEAQESEARARAESEAQEFDLYQRLKKKYENY